MRTVEGLIRVGRPIVLGVGWLLLLWGAFVSIAVFINLADVFAYWLSGRFVLPEWRLLLFVSALLALGVILRRLGGGRPFAELLRRLRSSSK